MLFYYHRFGRKIFEVGLQKGLKNLYQMLEKYLSVPSLHFVKYTEFALFNAVVNSSFPPYTYIYIVSHTSPVRKKTPLV